jgi:hypothetical protein
MNDKQKSNNLLNVLLVALSLILVTLVTLHVRQLLHAKQRDSGETPSKEVHASKQAMSQPTDQDNARITITTDNAPIMEEQNVAERPATVSGSLELPVEAQKALRKQTQQLLEETLGQPAQSNDHRALAISKEAILQLEQEGRMVY